MMWHRFSGILQDVDGCGCGHVIFGLNDVEFFTSFYSYVVNPSLVLAGIFSKECISKLSVIGQKRFYSIESSLHPKGVKFFGLLQGILNCLIRKSSKSHLEETSTLISAICQTLPEWGGRGRIFGENHFNLLCILIIYK